MRIISELSLYDAWLLKQIYENKNDIAIRNPIINMKKGSSGAYLILSHIPFFIKNYTDHDKEKIGRSMDNLVRLKLISLVRVRKTCLKNFVYEDEPEMSVLGNEYALNDPMRVFVEFIRHNMKPESEIDNLLDQIDPRRMILTSFGHDFCATCIR